MMRNLLPLALALIMFLPLTVGLASAQTPTVSWSLGVTDKEGSEEIHQGSAVIFNITGEANGSVYIVVYSWGDNNTTTGRIPAIGFVLMLSNTTLLGWLLPEDFPVGNATAILFDSNETVLTTTLFEILPKLPPLRDTLDELNGRLLQFEFWKRAFERDYNRQQRVLNQQVKILFVALAAFFILTSFTLISAFSKRFPKLRAIFSSDTEESEKVRQVESLRLLKALKQAEDSGDDIERLLREYRKGER